MLETSGPDGVLWQIRSNKPIRKQRRKFRKQKGLLDQIIDEGRLAREETQKAYAKDLIGEFVGQVMEGTMTISKDTEAMINARIAQIDKLISDQLNEVMHHEEFQKLEGSWRGLHYHGEQERDRGAAENPGDECQQKRPAQGYGKGQ
jgi:predicted component of type VI protein secretion system